LPACPRSLACDLSPLFRRQLLGSSRPAFLAAESPKSYSVGILAGLAFAGGLFNDAGGQHVDILRLLLA